MGYLISVYLKQSVYLLNEIENMEVYEERYYP